MLSSFCFELEGLDSKLWTIVRGLRRGNLPSRSEIADDRLKKNVDV